MIYYLLPYLLLPYDNVNFFIENTFSQVFPLCSFYSIFYYLYRYKSIDYLIYKNRNIKLLLLFIITIFIVTAINIPIDYYNRSEIFYDFRFYAMFKQGTSLLLGICTFLMFSDSLTKIGYKNAFMCIIIAFIPVVAYSLYQILSNYDRIVGFSTEPSHLADSLVFCFLPATLFIKNKFIKLPLIILFLISLFFTYSSTGILKFVLFVLIFLLIEGKFLKLLYFFILVISFATLFLIYYNDNYIYFVISNIYYNFVDSGVLSTGSLIDKLYGFIGPLNLFFSPHGLLGYGLGGDSVYFNQLFDWNIAYEIVNVKSEYPSISSLQGKFLMYSGVFYVIYLKTLKNIYFNTSNTIIRSFICTIFISSMFSMGPFLLPYTWLMLSLGIHFEKSNMNKFYQA